MSNGRKRIQTPSECPVCGADIPPKAPACPACGADERTGWSEESTRYDGLDLPDEAFEDDAAPPGKGSPRPKGFSGFWWLVGIGMTLAMIYLVFGALF